MSNIAYKYRIYPDLSQVTLIYKTFGCCRKIWNCMYADREEYYKLHHTALQVTPAQYKNNLPYLKEVDSSALANVQMNLNTAYQRFFTHKSKRPKFKSKKHTKRSYTTNLTNNNIIVGPDYIKLPKLGKVKAVIHRTAPVDYRLKSATISQDSDGTFYCSVLYEYDAVIPTPVLDAHNSIGLDYKSDGLFVDDKNNSCDMPKYYKTMQDKIVKQQRRLAKKQGSHKGETKSNNWIKQQHVVNKLYCKAKRQRKDFLHKRSTEITNQYDMIFVENLDLQQISNKNNPLKLGKPTMDNGYGMFCKMLAYKAERTGKMFIKVDKYYPSSQLCSTCGYQNQAVKNLKIRKWACPVCGTEHDRDHNAAINIKNEGIKL